MSSVAVVMPALNEREATVQLLEEMPEKVCGIEIESYVIDGGSSDGTKDAVNNSDATLINQSYRGCEGAAIREGVEKIDAEIYVCMDADMTYPPEEMDKLVKPIKEGEIDHVMGSRLVENQKGAFKYRNFYANKMLGWLYRKLTDSEIQDFLTGYRAVSSDLAEKLDLNATGFEIETEITFKTLKLGEPIEEVDITYRPRVGESKLDFKKEGLRIPLYGLKLSLFRH